MKGEAERKSKQRSKKKTRQENNCWKSNTSDMFTGFMGLQYLFTAFISHFSSYILHCKTAVYCYQEINILEHMVLDQL